METKAGANNPNRLYTDFEPYCIWHRNEDNDILEVHLNGFGKEHLKVRINNAKILTILGERPLDDNKWSRFRKQIKLAENTKDCNIHSKLAKGILSIVMPKRLEILSNSIPMPSDVPSDVSVKPKLEKTTQKGNDTVRGNASPENVELSRMKLGSYVLGQKKSGWRLEMDKKMVAKIGLVLVLLLVGFGIYVKYSYRKPFDISVFEK